MIKKMTLFGFFVLFCNCGQKPTADGLESLATCIAPGAFNGGKPECREYLGDGWTIDTAQADCTGRKGEFKAAVECDRSAALGACVFLEKKLPVRVVTVDDPATCTSQKRGCELFGGGTWSEFALCGGSNPDDDGNTGQPIFIQPTVACVPPLPGSGPGKSDGGLVCTWQGTQGCTEPGRNFADYASCEIVRTQRPALPAPVNTARVTPDSRLNDPSWKAESNWVKQQIESASCVCCHSVKSPFGAAAFSLDGERWLDTWFDSAIAAGAGAIDSTSFGVYPAEVNNGFIRGGAKNTPTRSIFASTDPIRMARFFENELTYRGRKPEDFADTPPFGGPVYEQQFFSPQPCIKGEGISADGSMAWRNGKARYVYVLEANSLSPTIPPNLDIPIGTIWRLDVSSKSAPLASGSIRYGIVPAGTSQRFPLEGPPAPLLSGRTYYLYTSVDVAIPATRCLFIAP